MTDENALAAGAIARPDDDIPRLVLADWYEDGGREKLARDLRTFSLAIVKRCAGGDGDGGYGDGGYGDGGYGAGGDGDGGDGDGGDGAGGDGAGGDGDGGDGDGGYGAGGYGDGGYGDGGYGDGGYGDGGYRKSRTQEIADMRDGLYILTIFGGYAPYVIVGWAKVCGLEIEMHGARIIRRFGGNAALAGLATNGPIAATQLLEPSPVEYLFRPSVGRVIPANAKKWKKECPQPESWTGEQ